jgi:hypothetical protein
MEREKDFFPLGLDKILIQVIAYIGGSPRIL